MAGGGRRGAGRGTRGRHPLTERPAPRRGTCYRVRGASPQTLGLLVVSAQRANEAGPQVTAVPVRSIGEGPTDIEITAGFAAVGRLIRTHPRELGDVLFTPGSSEQHTVDAALAELLLISHLCSPDPPRPSRPAVDHPFPEWGRIYCAEPPLSGETKRWLVVSHNFFNAAPPGMAVCLRTTSVTSLHSPVTPCIQRGLALAVAPDVMTKAHHRFDLASAERLPKPELAEMRKVAIALANHLGLGRFTGLLSRGTE